MKKYFLLIIVISFSLPANNQWNKLSFEFQKLSIAKLNTDMKLKSLNRRARSLYQKLNELFNRNVEMKKLSESLPGKLGKEREGILKKIDALQKQMLEKDLLLGEEYYEIVDKLNELNEQIYMELMKDPELKELQREMNAIRK